MSFRVKRNDEVIVIAGKEKGKTGKVIFVNTQKNLVKVENVNMVSRHKKARSAQESAGIRKMEGNIHISNVMIVCPSCSKPTRIGAKFEEDKKLRVCKKCGAVLESVTEKPKKGKKDAEPKAKKSSDSRVKRVRKSAEEKASEPAAIAQDDVAVNQDQAAFEQQGDKPEVTEE